MRALSATLLVLASTCWMTCDFANAEMVKVKGKGEVRYKGTKGPADEWAAINEAKKNALANYAARFDPARFELYKNIEQDLLTNIDQYVQGFTKLDSTVDKESELLIVIIEASINTSLIENSIQKQSHPDPNINTIAFVVVARATESSISFLPKRAIVHSVESTDKGGIAIEQNGGSTEVKSAKVIYVPFTVTEVDEAFKRVWSTANYNVSELALVGLDVEGFKKDFGVRGEISPATLNAAVKGCRKNDIRYLTVANMQVGVPSTDEATGLKRVYVTVTAELMDLIPRFPTTVASIAGKPYAGFGPDEQVAVQNGLVAAANRSASELLDQLRVKNVK